MDSEKSDEQIEIDRIAELKEREVSQALPKKETIPKQETKKEKISKTQQVKNLINLKLDSGYQLNDKNAVDELTKIICDEIKLGIDSWNSKIKGYIKDTAIKRKLQISDLGFKNDKIGDMTINLISETTSSPENQITVSSNISQSPHGVLPQNYTSSSRGSLPKETGTDNSQTRTEQSEEPEKKYMSESAQKKLISHGLTKLILPLYKAIGICELDESEEKEESKIPKGKQMQKDFEDLAGDIDEYLTENNIKLPALLNHLSIVISIFVVMVMPVIKFKMFSGSKEVKPTYDKDADSVKVD